MGTLRSLPPEIVAQINEVLCSRTVARLWLSGDSILQSRLLNGGVQSWRTFAAPYDLVVPCAGSLVSLFKYLKEYHVYTDDCVTQLPVGGPGNVPSGLTSLILISPNAFQFLAQSCPGPTPTPGSALRDALPCLLKLVVKGTGLKEWPILSLRSQSG